MSEPVVHQPAIRSEASVLFKGAKGSTKYAADKLKISEDTFSIRLHKLKRAYGLGGKDNVIVNDKGDVLDGKGEVIGNIYEEVG